MSTYDGNELETRILAELVKRWDERREEAMRLASEHMAEGLGQNLFLPPFLPGVGVAKSDDIHVSAMLNQRAAKLAAAIEARRLQAIINEVFNEQG